jgi:uncharacterized protein (TIGR02391 family)
LASLGFPTAEEAVELPVDELAFRLLRVFSRDSKHATRAYMGDDGFWGATTDDRDARHRATLRGVEAWDWLTQNGLLALRPGSDIVTGMTYVTERGHEVVRTESGQARARAEARIGLDLHPSIARRGRTQFLLGEYELAAFAAMREVEIRVRMLGGYSAKDVGIKLVRAAFHAETGPLRDPEQVDAEREATAHLFAGAIGTFKNPSSHRQVDFDDPTVAAEIVLLADLLLRMLDAVEARLAK